MSKLNHALPAGVAGLRIGADVNAAHVLSFAALFVALGGMAYALSANQVKSKHIAAGR
jgi:hypothetical protein